MYWIIYFHLRKGEGGLGCSITLVRRNGGEEGRVWRVMSF